MEGMMYGSLVTEEKYMHNEHYQRRNIDMVLLDFGWVMQPSKDKGPVNNYIWIED
jgi:hypothetical protein